MISCQAQQKTPRARIKKDLISINEQRSGNTLAYFLPSPPSLTLVTPMSLDIHGEVPVVSCLFSMEDERILSGSIMMQ